MKINNIQLTTIKATDIKELQELCIVTFNETFADTNSKKSLKKYMNESFSEKKLMDEINNPESEFYFAKLDGKAIGYLKVNRGKAQTELQDSAAMEIERIYVLKEYHGKGIGHILIDKAFQIAGSKKASYIWLGVWDKNLRAINFYKKYGFVEFDTHIFRMGDKEQTDLMIKLEL
jgi:ribosomal protein S18 acetylase RimI-like enzyme